MCRAVPCCVRVAKNENLLPTLHNTHIHNDDDAESSIQKICICGALVCKLMALCAIVDMPKVPISITAAAVSLCACVCLFVVFVNFPYFRVWLRNRINDLCANELFAFVHLCALAKFRIGSPSRLCAYCTYVCIHTHLCALSHTLLPSYAKH